MEVLPKIMITLEENGENGGPFISHERIMNSELKRKYNYEKLWIPKGKKGVFNPKLTIYLIKKIKKSNPKIVHIHGLQLVGFHVMIAAKLARKKTVLVVRGSSSEAINFSKWKKKIMYLLEKYTLNSADIVYGVSDYACNLKIVRQNSRNLFGTIYNLPPALKNEYIYSDFRKEIGVKTDDILIVSTGRITKEKGFEVLCEAIIDWNPPKNIKFIIVGDGEYLENFKKQVEKFKLEDQVFILGYRRDVEIILSVADIFVICSLHETLCNSILEAGRYSLPTVATNVGGIPEIIENDYNGFLVPINDAVAVKEKLIELTSYEEKRKKLGLNAKKRIDEKFSEEVIIEKIDTVYRSLLND